MAKPRKSQDEKDLDETRRIMARLVKMPHKPHKLREESKVGKNGPAKAKSKTASRERGRR